MRCLDTLYNPNLLHLGRQSIYMDDLYIKHEYRDRVSVHKLIPELSSYMLKKVVATKVRWQVSEWNAQAITFYKSLGAEIDSVERTVIWLLINVLATIHHAQGKTNFELKTNHYGIQPILFILFILPFILGLAYLTCFVTVWFIIYRWVKLLSTSKENKWIVARDRQ